MKATSTLKIIVIYVRNWEIVTSTTGMLVRYCPDLCLFSELLLTPNAESFKESIANLKISELRDISSELA